MSVGLFLATKSGTTFDDPLVREFLFDEYDSAFTGQDQVICQTTHLPSGFAPCEENDATVLETNTMRVTALKRLNRK